MVFWFAVIFGGKHAYRMSARKMLAGVCIIDRAELCKILNTYSMEMYVLAPIREMLPEENA